MTTPIEIELASALEGWMQQQRWFAAKGSDVTLSVQVLGELRIDAASTTVYAVTATAAGLPPQTYQVPLVFHDVPVPGMEHALAAVLAEQVQPIFVYDAMADRDAVQLWLAGLVSDDIAPAIEFDCPDQAEVPIGAAPVPLGLEQSNTSVVFGQMVILKLFRQLHPGLNPDVEVHRELSRIGAQQIAPFVGSASVSWQDAPTTLAMMLRFVPAVTTGWELALTSVQDLFALENTTFAVNELPMPMDEPVLLTGDLVAQAGGDFAGEAHRLGAAVASTHSDLARALGTSQSSDDWRHGLVRQLHERLDAALTHVPGLQTYTGAVREHYDAVALHDGQDGLQRIHGDLHLGQVLRAPEGWVIIDFEGEPSASIQARRAQDSVLRDVAGMLRSFDYAPQYQLMLEEQAGKSPQPGRATEWARRNGEAFCDGYAEVAGFDPRSDEQLLLAFQLDKAIYEAVYESRNRPAWAGIPMDAIKRLVDA